MEDNKVCLKDKNGNKKKYRILFNLEGNNINYLIYTDDIKKNNQINTFVSSYEISDKGNIVKFKNVSDEEELFISKILKALE